MRHGNYIRAAHTFYFDYFEAKRPELTHRDIGVRFPARAAFGMADDNETSPCGIDHTRADFACMRAAFSPMTVLRAEVNIGFKTTRRHGGNKHRRRAD